MSPATKVEIIEAWLLSTVNEPFAPGSVTDSTTPSNVTSAGDIIFSIIVFASKNKTVGRLATLNLGK